MVEEEEKKGDSGGKMGKRMRSDESREREWKKISHKTP